jgi:hypothetical protein
MDTDYFEHLKRIAGEMDQTRSLPGATADYDVLAGALVWSDEYPGDFGRRLAEFDCVKLLLRYRTTLLLGKADDALRPYWDYARERFPNWAGFSPARLAMTEELATLYERGRKWSVGRLEALDRLYRRAGDQRGHL